MKQSDALKILKAGRNVYLTGSAGSGKTHVLNKYIEYLKHRNVVVGITASTGIAATHIGGVTIHSWSGVGVNDSMNDAQIEALEAKEYLWKRFQKTHVLIIDEVSMLSPALFDTIDRICRAMKRSQKPFGGMQVVLSGDFFQLPPIMRNNSAVRFIDASNAWKEMDVRVCYLHEQFRQTDDLLEGILNEIRSGEVSDESREALAQCSEPREIEDGILPTRLYTHNADVDAENERELGKLATEGKTFEMSTKGKASLVGNLRKSILAPDILELKEGAVVMFVKNNFDDGYVNGTLGVVEKFDEGTPVVRTFSGKTIRVYSSQWSVEEEGKVLASVEQLPLRLAWAITVHKSQGMSMDAAEVDLSKSFVAGQGYVALSRLRTLSGLFLKGINAQALMVHPQVLVLDKHLLKESTKWEKIIARFDDKEMEHMHTDFIEASGGTNNPQEIEKNKKKVVEEATESIPTHEKTRLLIEGNKTVSDIAKERGQTVGTIIGHFEKLKDLNPNIDLKKFKPKVVDLKRIKEAFKKSKDDKLAPVHRALKGDYSYEDLRLARLYM